MVRLHASKSGSALLLQLHGDLALLLLHTRPQERGERRADRLSVERPQNSGKERCQNPPSERGTKTKGFLGMRNDSQSKALTFVSLFYSVFHSYFNFHEF